MGEVDFWEDKKFREVFEDEMRVLERRWEKDASVSIDNLEGILESLYIMSDRNCEGKVQEIVFSATIVAYESFISSKKAEQESEK